MMAAARGAASLRVALVLGLGCSLGAADLQIRGIVGTEEVVNGLYKQHGEAHGYPCYKNMDYKGSINIFLCIDAHGFWAAQPEAEVMAKTANVYLHSAKMYTETPVGAGPWMLWNAHEQRWKANPQVTVADIVPAELPLEKHAIAVCVWCVLIGSGLMAGFSSSHDKRVRSMTCWFISSIATVAAAALITNAVDLFIFGQFLPAPFPEGMGLGPVSPIAKMLVWSLIFTIGYVSISLVAWKSQNCEKFLAAVKTLGSNLVAFLGIYAFSNIQREAVLESGPLFQGPLLRTLQQAEMFTAILIPLWAWFVLALFRIAGHSLRDGRLTAPPLLPWGRPRRRPAQAQAPGGGAANRSCTPYFPGSGSGSSAGPAAGPPAARQEALEWKEDACDAEDDAAVTILGFLANQALVLYATGEMPLFPSAGSGAPRTASTMHFWWMTLAVLLLLSVLVAFGRFAQGGGGRIGSLAQRTVASALVWSLYRLVLCEISFRFQESRAIAHVVAAFGMFTAALLIIFIADKIFDATAGAGLDHVFNTLNSGRVALRERVKMTLTNSLGLLVGLSWGQVLFMTTDWLIKGVPAWEADVIIADVFFTLLLAAMLLLTWARLLLPQALLSEDSLEDVILLEVKQLLGIV